MSQYPIRLSPSGQIIPDGTPSPGQVITADALGNPVWATPVAGAGSVAPFSRVFFVDTLKAPLGADGSIGRPFASLQAAYNTLAPLYPEFSLIVALGSSSNLSIPDVARIVNIIGASGFNQHNTNTEAVIGTIHTGTSATVTISNCAVERLEGPGAGNPGHVYCDGCYFQNVEYADHADFLNCSFYPFSESNQFVLTNCRFTTCRWLAPDSSGGVSMVTSPTWDSASERSALLMRMPISGLVTSSDDTPNASIGTDANSTNAFAGSPERCIYPSSTLSAPRTLTLLTGSEALRTAIIDCHGPGNTLGVIDQVSGQTLYTFLAGMSRRVVFTFNPFLTTPAWLPVSTCELGIGGVA